MKTRLIILSFTLALLVACGGEAPDTLSESAPADTDHPIQAYDQALDRARDVNQDVLDAAQRQREAIEEQEGGG